MKIMVNFIFTRKRGYLTNSLGIVSCLKIAGHFMVFKIQRSISIKLLIPFRLWSLEVEQEPWSSEVVDEYEFQTILLYIRRGRCRSGCGCCRCWSRRGCWWCWSRCWGCFDSKKIFIRCRRELHNFIDLIVKISRTSERFGLVQNRTF